MAILHAAEAFVGLLTRPYTTKGRTKGLVATKGLEEGRQTQTTSVACVLPSLYYWISFTAYLTLT